MFAAGVSPLFLKMVAGLLLTFLYMSLFFSYKNVGHFH